MAAPDLERGVKPVDTVNRCVYSVNMSPTRDVLLDSAFRQMEEHGLEGLTLRSIARASGVSHAAPARHFDGLNGLLAAVAARSFQDLTATMDRYVAEIDDPSERLVAAGQAYVDYALANAEPYELMFRPERLDTEQPDYKSASAEAYGRLHQLVEAAQEAGWRRGVDHDHLTGVVWATIHGVVSLWIQGALAGATGIDTPDDLVNTLIHQVLVPEEGHT